MSNEPTILIPWGLHLLVVPIVLTSPPRLFLIHEDFTLSLYEVAAWKRFTQFPSDRFASLNNSTFTYATSLEYLVQKLFSFLSSSQYSYPDALSIRINFHIHPFESSSLTFKPFFILTHEVLDPL